VLSRDVLLLTSAAVILVSLGTGCSSQASTATHDGIANHARICRGAAGSGGLALVAIRQSDFGIPCRRVHVFSGFHYSIVVAAVWRTAHRARDSRRCATNRRVCSAGVSPVFLRRDGDLRKPPARRRRHEEPQSRRKTSSPPSTTPIAVRNADSESDILQVFQYHEAETCEYGEARNPAEQIGALALVDVGRLPDPPSLDKQVPRRKPAEVSEVVRTTHDQAKDGYVDQPADQGAA